MLNTQTQPSHLEHHRDRERLQTLYVVNDMLRQVEADGLDIHTILPRVLHLAVEEVAGKTGSIIVTNEHNRIEHFWHIDDTGQTSPNLFLGNIVDDGIAGWVIRNSQAAIVHDTTDDSRWLPRPDHPTAQAPWSALCAPLHSRESAIGAITITKEGANQFSNGDLDLLSAIATQASSSIENARLFEDSHRRAEELTTLVTATLSVSTTLQVNEVLTIVTEQMTAMVRATTCYITQWDKESGRLTPWRNFPSQAEDPSPAEYYPYSSQVLQNRRPLQLRHNSANLDPIIARWMSSQGIKSLLLMPLMAQASTIGLVQLIDKHETRDFSNHEVALVQTLSSQAAIAIENARLYNRTKRQLKESALLNEAGAVINSSLNRNEIMQSILTMANELLHVEAISVALVDFATNELVYEIGVGTGSDEIVGLRLPADQGVSGWVMEHDEAALVPNTRNDPRFHSVGDKRTGMATRAIICAPLATKGKVLGTVQAINPHVGTFNDDDLGLLVKLANLASSAIANAQQFAETQAAEARYQGLFEDSIDAIVLSDLSGNIIGVNHPACKFLGYKKSELLDLNVQILHPKGSDLVEKLSFEHISDEVQQFTSEIFTQSGIHIPVEVYAKRLGTGVDSILQWIYHDITQQVELEQMREDLMAMLFHDLQSPLGNVISSLELMEHELSEVESPMAVAILDIATRSTQRLRTLIKSLLDINRLEAGTAVTDREMVAIDDIVTVGHDAINPTLERRHIGFKFERKTTQPVFADKDMITRVLINLLDNALKFSQDEDALTVTVADVEGDMVQFSIADEGPGIPEELRGQIFEKFYRVPGQAGRKGIGLGLAFCRLALEAHKGQIWASAAPSGGAQFNFTLPTEAI